MNIFWNSIQDYDPQGSTKRDKHARVRAGRTRFSHSLACFTRSTMSILRRGRERERKSLTQSLSISPSAPITARYASPRNSPTHFRSTICQVCQLPKRDRDGQGLRNLSWKYTHKIRQIGCYGVAVLWNYKQRVIFGGITNDLCVRSARERLLIVSSLLVSYNKYLRMFLLEKNRRTVQLLPAICWGR